MKIIKIRSCGECPHLHYPKMPYCKRLNKLLPYNEIAGVFMATYKIPKDCPLEDKK